MSGICRHCGNAISREVAKETAEAGFCCSGCEYVYRLIRGQDLDKFYDLRNRKVDLVGSFVFRPRDFRWLKGLADRAEKGCDRRAVLNLRVQGISCVGCVWLIEKVVLAHPGTRVARVNASAGTLRLEWVPGRIDLEKIALELQRFGYLLGPPGAPVRSESSRLTLRLGLCAAFAMNAMLFTLPVYLGMKPDFWFAWLFSGLAFAFATLALAVGGSYFFQRSLAGIRRGVIHIDLPISLGLIIAYFASCYGWFLGRSDFIYFDFVATFSFLMLVGRWTQQIAVERNRNRLLDARLGLPRVEMIADLTGESSCVDRLQPGDVFRVDPGEAVPVCSQLRAGDASFGLDWISGESEAQAARNGQLISAGAINLSPEAVELRAMETWDQSLLSRLLSGEENLDRDDPLLERIIRWYLLAVLFFAVAGAAGWLFFTGQVLTALQVAISVLVVSCPCALGVSLPLLDEMAATRMRRLGVYVQTDHLWSRLRRIRTIVFDKTGTLTLEAPTLINRGDLQDLEPVDLAVLWTMVRTSRHPVSSCLREALLAGGWIDEFEPAKGSLREEVGQGLEWIQEDRTWRLGRPEWAVTSSGRGGSKSAQSVFSRDGVLLVELRLRDEVRAGAPEEVGNLGRLGYDVHVLSGDRRTQVDLMVQRLGLPPDRGQAEMTPDEKADWIRSHQADRTLMIGDGANDSLAFDAAGCRGTPAIDRGLLEQKSDFFFLGRSLSGVRQLMETARQHGRVASGVLAFAVSYNGVAVVVCLGGGMNPLLAAILMPLSAIISLTIATYGMKRPLRKIASPRSETR